MHKKKKVVKHKKVPKKTKFGVHKKKKVAKFKKQVKGKKKKIMYCASSSTGVFAFFTFLTLNLSVMVDFVFSAMVTIMINAQTSYTSCCVQFLI